MDKERDKWRNYPDLTRAAQLEKEADLVKVGLELVAAAGLGLLSLVAGAFRTSSPELRREPRRELQRSLHTEVFVAPVPFGVGELEMELTREELIMVLENLGPYSDTIDANGRKLLKHISRHFKKCFKWVKKTVSVMSTAIIFLNIIRYFYRQLILPIMQESGNVGSGELHIVLVGNGSFNDQVRPADWLVPADSITDTILYSPWNCSIDAKVAYGIATGDIELQHRDFRSSQGTTLQQPVPERWNSMRAQQRQPIPEIILGPMKSTADWISHITASADWLRLYICRNRLVIPYPPGGALANWLPEVPLYMIIGAIELLFMITLPYKATIHLAADLKYGGSTQPDVEMLEEQYACTPDGTVMTTQNMQFTDLEFPMLYGIFRSMFDPAPPLQQTTEDL